MAAWPIPPNSVVTFSSLPIARQNFVPCTQDSAVLPAPYSRPWVTPSGTFARAQSLPDNAARAGVASPAVTTMDAPAASAPSIQPRLLIIFKINSLTAVGNSEVIVEHTPVINNQNSQ